MRSESRFRDAQGLTPRNSLCAPQASPRTLAARCASICGKLVEGVWVVVEIARHNQGPETVKEATTSLLSHCKTPCKSTVERW